MAKTRKKIQDDWMISNYRAKDCDLSCSDICMPSSQLWSKLRTVYEDDKEVKKVGFKSFLGSALHEAIEKQSEDGTIKEFSWVRTLEDGTKIGGTTDELRYRTVVDKWRLGDIKLKGAYPAKKFLGIGTKADPYPPKEQDKEILQMSIYRWLFEGMFDIEDKAVIYLFVPGHSSWEKFPEYQEVFLDLHSIDFVGKYIKEKLIEVNLEEQPENTCPAWLCNFCDYTDVCGYYEEPEENNMDGFTDENTNS